MNKKSSVNNYTKGKDTPTKNDPSSLNARIVQLEEEIRQLALTIDKVEDEKQQIENQMKKALADYQNLERAMDKRMDMKSIQLRKHIAQDLLILMDDVQYGLNAVTELTIGDDVQAWIQGLVDTMSKMKTVLESLDIQVTQVNVGDQFDSGIHEAIAVVDQGKENTVVEIVQPGYVMGEMVIRPARVVVSKKLAK